MTERKPKPRELTIKRVQGAKATGKLQRLWCSKLTGLVLVVSPKGARTYYWQRRHKGTLHRIKLGSFDPAHPEKSHEVAKHKAQRCNLALLDGNDPNEVLFGRSSVMTVNDAWQAFLPETEWSERTVKETGYQWRRHIDADFGNRPIEEVTTADVAAILTRAAKKRTVEISTEGKTKATKKVVGGPVTSNRLRAALSALFSWAVEHGLVEANPVSKTRPRKERPRDRVLEADEVQSLLEALDGSRSKDFADVVRLLLLTACRSGEILGLRWSEVTLGGSQPRLTISRHRAKARMTRKVPLIPQAVEVLESREQGAPEDFVFPTESTTGHLNSIKKSWTKLIDRAGINHANAHDLRRTVAQAALDAGADYAVVTAILGHSARNLGITSVYAVPSLDRQRTALEMGVARLTTGPQTAEVVQIGRKKSG